MKQALDKLMKNPYWIFITSIISLKDLLKDFFLIATKQSKMSFSDAILHTDWWTFFIQLFLVSIVYYALRRNTKLQDKITAIENKDEELETITDTMYIRFLRLNFRVECSMGHNGQQWHPQAEKELVRQYLKRYNRDKSVEDFEKLMSEHFPELPNLVF